MKTSQRLDIDFDDLIEEEPSLAVKPPADGLAKEGWAAQAESLLIVAMKTCQEDEKKVMLLLPFPHSLCLFLLFCSLLFRLAIKEIDGRSGTDEV